MEGELRWSRPRAARTDGEPVTVHSAVVVALLARAPGRGPAGYLALQSTLLLRELLLRLPDEGLVFVHLLPALVKDLRTLAELQLFALDEAVEEATERVGENDGHQVYPWLVA